MFTFDRKSRPSAAHSPARKLVLQRPAQALRVNPLWLKLATSSKAVRTESAPLANAEAAHLERPSESRQRKGCGSCLGGAPCASCSDTRTPDTGTQLHQGTPSSDPAERQADAIGALIGAELEGVGVVSPGFLSPHIQRVAERHLGVDLGGTRLIDGEAGHRRASAERALAVTEGSEVSFLSRHLTTRTRVGRTLLGHELTHVAQQRAAGTSVQRYSWDDFISTDWLIGGACAALPDEWVVEVARSMAMQEDGPASRHLDHYLRGGGSDYNVDSLLREVILRDQAVRNKLALGIIDTAKKHPSGKLDGSVPIRQIDYSVREYQLAIGSMFINFFVDDSQESRERNRASSSRTAVVLVSVRDLYRWHPTAGRKTQCVHEAAEALKTNGAKDYWMVGSARVLLELPEHLIPK